MKQQGRRTQGEVIDYIEQRLGWEVTDSRLEEHKSYRDEPGVLRLEIHAELELEDDENPYRYDPNGGATQ